MEVLLVDDHPLVNEIFSALVSKVFTGAKVSIAKDLETALTSAAARSPNLVLLDLGLPGCSGIEALERFRAAFPAAPVLVVSSNEDPACMQASLAAGAYAYMPKTASLDEIARAMQNVAAGERQAP